ncbi:cytochrome c3 family protein [Neobacillus drentensis]|uniref:cytochrome c3 family protein n=1 Tax=Neobacillus drentensis TaxID=220684 RepID=UPI002FFF3430
MRKFSISLLFAIMLFGMFAAAASAASMTPGQKGTSIENSNKTAEGVDTNDGTTAGTVIKALTGQKMHTSYQNNTNSCASCHQTHTAKGDSLLFSDTVYNTCTACHDGTLGFANVFASGETAKMTGAGTFGGTHGSSQHMANDTIKIKAAPGGNPDPEGDDKTNGTAWGENFNCASCHAPHGSYSDRLLSYNPNGIASMPASQGGMQLENVPVVDTLPAMTTPAEIAAAPAVVLYRTTDGTSGVVTVAQYNKGASAYTKSEAPWLYGYDNRTDGKTYWSRFMKDATTVAAYGSTAGVYFDYEHAQAYSTADAGKTALNNAATGFLARPVVVKMEKDEATHTVNQAAYFGGSTVTKMGVSEQKLKDLGYTVKADGTVTGIGVAMSKFCAACHTDYLAASGTKSTHFGDANSATAAYRHSTTSDSYTCVRCHYGHGTDAYIMKDSLGRTINDLVTAGQTEADALNYMQDNNASSALKKFTNMSVCWACHNSSHAESIKNTERSADHPVGMPTGY